MKKRTLLVILTFILVLTGCGNEKKVTCSMNQEFEVGYKLEAKLSGDLNNDEVRAARLVMTMSFDDEKLAQSSYEVIQKEYMDSESKVDINIKEKVITITEDVEYKEPLSKQDFINTYQEEGYTCG